MPGPARRSGELAWRLRSAKLAQQVIGRESRADLGLGAPAALGDAEQERRADRRASIQRWPRRRGSGPWASASEPRQRSRSARDASAAGPPGDGGVDGGRRREVASPLRRKKMQDPRDSARRKVGHRSRIAVARNINASKRLMRDGWWTRPRREATQKSSQRVKTRRRARNPQSSRARHSVACGAIASPHRARARGLGRAVQCSPGDPRFEQQIRRARVARA